MKIFSQLLRWAGVLLALILLLIVSLAVLATLRVSANHSQQDNSDRIASKQAYLSALAAGRNSSDKRPNIIFVLYDDLGYGDIGHGAGDMIQTPNIDQLAANGVTMDNFYAPAAVCTPSRAGFLTGRLPARAGLPNVVYPTGSPKDIVSGIIVGAAVNTRLPAEEITIAEVLSAAGYATGMVGKWHLGDRSPSLPNDLGFDSFYGALYSNDLQPFAFYRNQQVAMAAPVDQTSMSAVYSKEVTDFIAVQQDQPFFLYLAHNFPHDPLFVDEQRSGQSDAGLYGDVVEELDQGIGEMVSALKKSGQLDNTLIIITSDNGPWFLGGAGNQRGRKGNTFEGGMRVPFIAHWPAQIAGGRLETGMAMGTDLLPTVLDLLDLPAPPDRILDGESILPLLTTGGESPHEFLYYYAGEKLLAVREQRFKYRQQAPVFYAPDSWLYGLSSSWLAAFPGVHKEWLFDLAGDPTESYDTSNRHPQALERLQQAHADKVKAMAENKRGWTQN